MAYNGLVVNSLASGVDEIHLGAAAGATCRLLQHALPSVPGRAHCSRRQERGGPRRSNRAGYNDRVDGGYQTKLRARRRRPGKALRNEWVDGIQRNAPASQYKINKTKRRNHSRIHPMV